ncbi:putative thiazole-containing bacteriocin maturation protein [Paenibacillus thermoaerophilus]
MDLSPLVRLKVKNDTFFFPDDNGGVYFRNNRVSFRMEGETIDQWIENLLPVLNGEHTLEELTDGLPDEYRARVYEIAQVLYRNGFVRDVSRDRPHQLDDGVLRKYASQIEFLDNFGDSGAYRFQTYRQAKVLAVGSGPFMVSLASALLESGLPRFHLLITDSAPTNRQRLAELAAHARQTDPEVAVEEVAQGNNGANSWRETVRPYDAVVYVSQEGDVEELRAINAACREEKKIWLPAICLEQAGLAGPLAHPQAGGCWESALRRLHRSAILKDPKSHAFSSTAGAMLANVVAFELLKTVAGVNESAGANKFFLLDLETLEGSWHSFFPHPMANGLAAAERIEDFELRLEHGSGATEPNRLLPYFSRLTSAESGIFHLWEEGELKQLPLAQCRVQAADPLSEGPAGLLPETICAGLTHEEARREAGLAGIEAYVSRMAGRLVPPLPSHSDEAREFIGVGAGETVAEGISRALHKCLEEAWRKRPADGQPAIVPVRMGAVEDERCRFYLQALTTWHGAPPEIGLGTEVHGFPAVWVGANGSWHGSVGLHPTLALREALKRALQTAQNAGAGLPPHAPEASPALPDEHAAPPELAIPAIEEASRAEVLRSALRILQRNGKRLLVFDLAREPFLQEELAGVFGVLLTEGESR